MLVGRRLTAAFRTCRVWRQYRCYKATMTSLLVPQESVRGMTHLDRSAFTTVVEVPCLKFCAITISKVTPILKKYLFKGRKLKPIQKVNDETIAYLNPTLVKRLEDITENDRNLLSGLYKKFELTKLTLNYENWCPDEILRCILPEGIEVPTSYSLVGHIVHINLRDVHLPYKTVIGQVFLDFVPNARTVVNKINTIDTTFRHFTMEILAGDKDTITVVKEHGFTYQFDFAQVYWNPRLSTEHNSLIQFMKPGDILYDVFAGVGPFAIPAARKGIKVFANDLNPESYKWLQNNAVANKVKDNFQPFNMDGRDFLKNVVKSDILNRRIKNEHGSEHITMNLPAFAIEFLDVFFLSFNREEIQKICSRPPTIHLYCFVKAKKGEDVCRLGKLLVEEKIGYPLNSNTLTSLHFVRNVAPNKEMIRVSFLLTEDILKGEEPAMKKLKREYDNSVFLNDDITENNETEQEFTKEPEEQKCVQSSNNS